MLPCSPYGITKMIGEHYLGYYQKLAGIQAVCLRYANVYGPRQDPHGEAGVVAIFTQKMLRGEQSIINGNGRQTRDFIYVDDVVEANLAVLGKDVSGAYNVGTGVETTINDLHKLLSEYTSRGVKEIHGPGKKGEQARSVIDSSKLRHELGWEPRVSLEEGLRRTVEYFKGQAV
jgi:UDP-glucose 4-epimerase